MDIYLSKAGNTELTIACYVFEWVINGCVNKTHTMCRVDSVRQYKIHKAAFVGIYHF